MLDGPLGSLDSAELQPELAMCSSRGCRAGAEWAIAWNNPKVHAPARRKIWLACREHRQSLTDFLSVRGFVRGVEPFDQPQL